MIAIPLFSFIKRAALIETIEKPTNNFQLHLISNIYSFNYLESSLALYFSLLSGDGTPLFLKWKETMCDLFSGKFFFKWKKNYRIVFYILQWRDDFQNEFHPVIENEILFLSVIFQNFVFFSLPSRIKWT